MELLAKEWLRLDKDPGTRSEIAKLLEERNIPELESRLAARLAFGTAGLRAKMGAGFARLNSLTIIQTSQGLAEFLLEESEDSAKAGVVIGYDARHNSKKFAKLAAAAFVAKGIRVWWYEDLVHTPMVPFGMKTLGAAAGIMITASHNPAQDNGYKVYGSNGCQINTPVDSQIAAYILKNLEPVTWDTSRNSPLQKSILVSTRAKYLTTVNDYMNIDLDHQNGKRNKNFVYTPMHGVGLAYMLTMLENVDNTMVVVEEQAAPNPDFPTVSFPNPEENGALDLAKSTADLHRIRLVLANDPDADRFAAAEKVDGHGWFQFTGDQVGVLLAHFLISRVRLEAKIDRDDFMLTSTVSSQMLASIAAREGFSVCETLTGFKWLGNTALDLERQGKRVIFAYEEALGYMFPGVVHDKDGIVAAGMFLNACAEWGGSPYAQLQKLYREYGYFETMNTYWRSDNPEATIIILNEIRRWGIFLPRSPLAGREVLRWRDLSTGYDSSTPTHKTELPYSPGSQMITCWLSDASDTNRETVRFTIRASGTEPKIKIYLECRSDDPIEARDGAAQVLKHICLKWFQNPAFVVEERCSGI